MKNKFRRRSIRLPEYDYSSEGNYFITICTKNKEEFFGKVINGKMILSETGNIVEAIWKQIPDKFSNIILGEFQVMPDRGWLVVIHYIPLPGDNDQDRRIIR